MSMMERGQRKQCNLFNCLVVCMSHLQYQSTSHYSFFNTTPTLPQDIYHSSHSWSCTQIPSTPHNMSSSMHILNLEAHQDQVLYAAMNHHRVEHSGGSCLSFWRGFCIHSCMNTTLPQWLQLSPHCLWTIVLMCLWILSLLIHTQSVTLSHWFNHPHQCSTTIAIKTTDHRDE